MLVRLSGARQSGTIRAHLREAGNQARVTFQLPEGPVSVDVSAIHMSRDGIGLQLTHRDARFLPSVQRAARLVAVEELAIPSSASVQRATMNATRRTNLIRTTNLRMSRFLEAHLPGYIEAFKTALLDEAERQRNQAAQQPFFDTLAMLRKQQVRLSEHIAAKLAADAVDVAKGVEVQNVQGDKGRDERRPLSLIEKNEFEDWLIIRKSISKTEIILREQLIELQLRLDAAFGTKQGTHCYNPYSPAAVCYAFADATRQLQLTGKVQAVAYKVLYELLLVNLDQAYNGLNRALIDAGVLPDIDVPQYLADQARRDRESKNKNKAPRPADAALQAGGSEMSTPASRVPGEEAMTETGPVLAAVPTPVPPSSPASADAQSADQPERSQPAAGQPGSASHAFNTATRLWAAHKRISSGDTGQMLQAEEYLQHAPPPSGKTLTALQRMQQQLLAHNLNLDTPGALKQQLSAGSGGQEALSEYEQDSADMIENLFDNIVSKDHVALELRQELRKLEVPILRVMLQDPALFTADFHPARQAVNHIALLSDSNSLHPANNRDGVRKAIATILESSDDNGFSRALLILDKLVAREKGSIERNLWRIAEACEGQQRINQAKQLIDRELSKRLSFPPVPTPLLDLVEHGWKDLMMLCLFREGDDSRPWDLTLTLIDQLVTRTVPQAPAPSGSLLKVDALLRLVGKGLSKVHDAEGRHDQIVAQLEQLLHGKPFPFDRYQSRADALTANDGHESDKSAHRWIKRAKSLRKGQWLESLAPPRSPELYQIAWLADDFSQYVFANQHGVKVAELSLSEVADRLRDKRLNILDRAVLPAVEQGLDELVQKIYEKLAFDASHDQLTGLRTRKEFSQCIAKSVAEARQFYRSHTLIFIDILQFKLINNTCGYEAGDRLLQELSARIQSTVDEDAIVGRIGAAEFAVLVPLDVELNGYALATRLKSNIENQRFEDSGQSFVISSVVTLVGFDETNELIMDLLRSVESAAEICKKSGRKDIQVVRPGDARIEERDEVMSWVTRINRALDEETLKIRCQQITPIHNRHADQIHYEVLLTVVDDNGEHVPPAEFIKAAEEFNRMGAVDRWVVETVLKWMAEHLDQLGNFGGFSINLSGHSLNDESFMDFLFDALLRYQVPRDKLIFEITETTAVANLEDAADFISEMRGIGCRFSLDDFGVGQSSFSYLKRLPVDFIKIDGSFVINIATDTVDYALVKSITEMGHFLDKKIIAEFVADADILEAVTSIGVDYAQGYHFGRHVMLDDLTLVAASQDSEGY